MENDNLIEEASQETTSEEAVAETSASESVETADAEASAQAETTQAQRLYAGKFKADTELEHGYLNLEKDYSRVSGELAAYKRSSQPTTSNADPIADKIQQLETERGKWEQYAARDDISWAERSKALSQISRHDREIGGLETQSRWKATSTKEAASQALESDAHAVFETYKQDLSSPGSPLYAMAEQRYLSMLRAGYPDGTAAKADAVLWAAHKSGVSKTRVVQEDRKGLMDHLQKAGRTAQKNGAGTATVVKTGGVTAQQIKAMTDAEFAKYERETVLGA